MTASIMY